MLEITGDDTAALNDKDLRTFVGLLSEEEIPRRRLAVSAVTWGGNQDAKDGGLDVRVALPPETSIDDFIPKPATGFHVVDAVVTVEDAEIVDAVLWLFSRAKIVAEPSGAAATAAVLTGALDRAMPIDGAIVAIVSGGNMSAETLRGLDERNGQRQGDPGSRDASSGIHG